MEEIYRVRRNERCLNSVRTALITAPIVCLLFGVWDLRTDAALLTRTIPVRTFFCAFWLLLWRTSFQANVRQNLGWILTAAVTGAFIALAWLLNIVPDGMVKGLVSFAYPQFALLLLPNFRIATVTNLAMLALVNIWAWWFFTAPTVQVNTNFMLFPLSCLACSCIYANELRDRKLFALEFALEGQATTDSLSGVSNRGHFFKCAQIEIDRSHRYGHPAALLMLDIDKFKVINDSYGHHIGDDAIRMLAGICAETLRVTDYLGRVGGEEFAILLSETCLEPAVLVAERLRTLVSESPLRFGEDNEQTHWFTVSIGVAVFRSGDTLEDLMQRADKALYAAKDQGRDRVVVCASATQAMAK